MAWQKSTATISCWKKDLQAVPISHALQSTSSTQGAQSSWDLWRCLTTGRDAVSGDCALRACCLLVDGLKGCAAVYQQHRESESQACPSMQGVQVGTLRAALTKEGHRRSHLATSSRMPMPGMPEECSCMYSDSTPPGPCSVTTARCSRVMKACKDAALSPNSLSALLMAQSGAHLARMHVAGCNLRHEVSLEA